MSYEFYKIMHLTCLAIAFSGLGIQLFAGVPSKLFKILGGIMGLLILVSGMGLIAKIGINQSEGWPLWIKLKFGVWAFIAIGAPVVGKRFPAIKKQYYWFTVILFVVGVSLANYKP